MGGKMPFWNKLPGDPTKRELKRYQAIVDEINELEEEISQLTDEQLRAKTDEFRQRLGVTGPDLSHGQSAVTGSYETSFAGDEADEIEAEQKREEQQARDDE